MKILYNNYIYQTGPEIYFLGFILSNGVISITIPFLFISTLLKIKGDIIMSDVIISRRGSAGGGLGNMKAEVIITNTQWVVPPHKGNIMVRIFGGGGGGTTIMRDYQEYRSGGGGGWMNNGEFNIATGSVVPISIGTGGKSFYINTDRYTTVITDTKAGGTSSFGTYLSAGGGSAGIISIGGSGGSGGSVYMYLPNETAFSGGRGYQFGGGSVRAYNANSAYCYGGEGGIWGGGGSVYLSTGTIRGGYGGKGGTYGGGGGIYCWYANGGNNNMSIATGGTYGGNGGYYLTLDRIGVAAKAGTNTIGLNTVPENCRGAGRVLSSSWAGGGYGGNSGTGAGAGAGGYGGNGGTYGGGGGYGQGADGDWGGGGYFSKGGFGGGSYGSGATANVAAGYGGGGAASNSTSDSSIYNGGNGVCIIQYYT